MARSKPFRFNQHNQRELKTAKAIAHAHIFSKDSFMSIGTKTMFYKYMAAGLIQPIEEKSGYSYYSITPRFISAYQSQLDSDYKSSSSGSVVHSAGIMRVVSSIIPSSAKIESEGVLKEEFQKFQKTTEYLRKENELKIFFQNRTETLKIEMKNTNILMEKYDKISEFNLCNKFQSGIEKLCSVPDLRITVNREEINELINNIRDMDRSSEREEAYARNAVRTLREIEETMETEVEIYIEVTTSNYGTVELQQKENFARVTDTRIIYFAAPEE